jgi:hypothetical protein
MEITESEFDKLVAYTLRIELLNGKVLIYGINTESKKYLINRLRDNADGDFDKEPLPFLWFETSLNRKVIVNADEIARITFCFDYLQHLEKPNAYYDNFGVVEKDTELLEKSSEGDTRLHVLEEEYLPQAIVYHKGKEPEDNYDANPLLYSSLDEGCLETFNLELEGDVPIRQFINLIDNDGEETFIPMKQIIIMEFDSNLMFSEEANEIEDENDKN